MIEKKNKPGILVAMSGGVDSAAAVFQLKNSGYDVSGITFRLYEEDSFESAVSEKHPRLEMTSSGSGQTEDPAIRDAAESAASMGIRHYVRDCRRLFTDNVITNFRDEYIAGLTPNPCIRCNKTVKIPELERAADELGINFIATGHYARVSYDRNIGRYLLLKASDEKKDQSYVLYNLNQKQLERLLLPLGNLKKDEVREIARRAGLEVAEKQDSQDICFVPDGDYGRFLREKCGVISRPGEFVLRENGCILGEHKGIINYTIGQRKGLGLGGGRPFFVLAKDTAANRILLGDNADLFSTALYVKDINYIAFDKAEVKRDIKLTAKLRYSQKEAAARLHPLSETEAILEFDQPQRAVTPGQSAVFYDDEVVIGGGIISTDNSK